jgi:hypothetical protein
MSAPLVIEHPDVVEQGFLGVRVFGELIVSYRSEPLLGLLVPVELREQYTMGGVTQPTITGKVTYANFRRFQVSTDQTLFPVQ